MKREKESKEKGLTSRIILERKNKAPFVRASATGPDGVGYVVDTHSTIVEAVVPSFLMRQKQTEDTPFMTSPLLNDLGYLVDAVAHYLWEISPSHRYQPISLRIHLSFSYCVRFDSRQTSSELYCYC